MQARLILEPNKKIVGSFGSFDTSVLHVANPASCRHCAGLGWEGKERWRSISITYDELMGSTVHINKCCLLSAFAYFKEDDRGYITADPLEEVCWEYTTS
ncbi:hypothetical protein ZWY2020_006806 [Hordeum vulgare]|nr:hypothetical protein ZWY2020_006806 [Hordeum vulgare]